MTVKEPETELNPRFSSPGTSARPRTWRRIPTAEGSGEAVVFEVAPATAFGFGKGEYSQARWRFE